MKKIIIFGLIIIGVSGYPQDPHFTQFYSSPLFLGPSFAGGIAGHRSVANYRNQWLGIPDAYQTFSLSYDHNFMSFHSGLGFVAVRDQAGTGNLGNTKLGILYSYDFTPFPEWHLRPGLGFYLQQVSLDFYRLVFGDQLYSNQSTSVTQAGKTAVYDIDVASSLLLFSDNVWLGASWDHMLRPTNSLYDDESLTPYKFSVYGGARYILKGFLLSKIEESVTGVFHIRKQDVFSQLDLGLYWFREPISFGVWYRGIPISKTGRKIDALAFMIGYKLDQFSIAYSYDFTISHLGLGSGGSHEVSFIYEFKAVRTKKRWKPIPCPTF